MPLTGEKNISSKKFYRTIFLLFFLSGFCGLLYQIVWIRLAFASFGVVTPVLSVVVSVFMLGLAVGSWWGGKVIRPLTERTGKSPFLFYALVESLIGLGGLLVPSLFHIGQSILLPSGDFNSVNYLGFSALILSLSIFPWCFCMGATTPFVLECIKRYDQGDLRGFSFLYLANVIGAMCGSLFTVVFAIELLGFQKSLLLAAAYNLVIALISLQLSFRLSNRVSDSSSECTSSKIKADDLSTSHNRYFILSILFVTGFTSMAMEVIWTRAFTPVLENTIYAFASILTVYLLSTWMGAWLYRKQAGNRGCIPFDNLIAWLIYFAFLPILLNDTRMMVAFWMKKVLVLLAIVPFCATLGYLTSKLIDEISHGDPKQAGRAYAVNAGGCILGPLLAGYLLLPNIGVRWALIVLIVPFVFYGAYFFKDRGLRNIRKMFLAGGLIAALFFISARFILCYEDSIFYRKAQIRRDYVATIISLGEGRNKLLLVNGLGVTALVPVTKFMAHIPLALVRGQPDSALAICLGMGTTLRSAASWGINATAVELVPSVRDAFGYYFADAGEILKNPKVRIVVDDGRRFLNRVTEKYDIITIDPPPPIEAAGTSLLYSEEFYKIAKLRLKEGGILQQWLPYADPETLFAVVNAIRNQFPEVRVFRSIDGWGFHFFAAMHPIEMPSAAEFERKLPEKARIDFTEWNPEFNVQQYYQKFLIQEIPLELLSIPDTKFSITDDRPYNEYYMVRRLWGFLSGRNRETA